MYEWIHKILCVVVCNKYLKKDINKKTFYASVMWHIYVELCLILDPFLIQSINRFNNSQPI